MRILVALAPAALAGNGYTARELAQKSFLLAAAFRNECDDRRKAAEAARPGEVQEPDEAPADLTW